MPGENEGFERMNIEVGPATKEELGDIIRIQQQNLGRNLSEDQREKGGFVNLETPLDFLQKIQEQNRVLVARHNGHVVGYQIPLKPDEAASFPVFNEFLNKTGEITFKDKPLNASRFLIIAQTCRDRNEAYRGHRISEKLYDALGNQFADTYDVAVGQIAQHNEASVRAHERKGFVTIARYSHADGNDRRLEALDLEPYRKEHA